MATNKLENKMDLRRLRQSRWVRELVREVRVDPSQMIQPLFVVQGLKSPESIEGLSGVMRETPDSLLRTIEQDLKAGVHKFILFGVPNVKTTGEFSAEFTATQIRAIKRQFGADLFLAADVCVCSHTTHGHCGVLDEPKPGVVVVDNAESVLQLARLALEYVSHGADCVAPSDMMDGRIGAIRHSLDESGYESSMIMSYSAKFHSSFYGPFRLAADSAPSSSSLSDRSTYQIDPTRPKDAYLSSMRDAEQGADILMVKPAMPYLDVLAELSSQIDLPWAVYQVSGEFASIELLAKQGLMNGPRAHVEAWTAFVRAGASMIITYGARKAKTYLAEVSL